MEFTNKTNLASSPRKCGPVCRPAIYRENIYTSSFQEKHQSLGSKCQEGVEGICRKARGYMGVQRRYKGVEGICRRVRGYMGVQRRYKGVEGICGRVRGIYGITKTIQGSKGDM